MDVYFVGGGVVDGGTVKGIIKDKQMENSRIRLVLDVWMENEEGQKVIVGSASSGMKPGREPYGCPALRLRNCWRTSQFQWTCCTQSLFSCGHPRR